MTRRASPFARPLALVALLLVAPLSPLARLAPFAPIALRTARADATDACIEANAATQRLRKEHKLIAARAQADACARESCPALVRKECAGWSRELEAATPKLTVVALAGAGAPVTDARLFLDGAPIPGGADGAPHPVDPGTHTVRVERDGAAPRTQTVDVHADVRILVDLTPDRPAEPAPVASTSPTTHAPAPTVAPLDPASDAASAPTAEARPVPTSVYLLGTLGAVGLGTFAVTGLIGKHRYDTLRDTCPSCSDADRDAAKTMLHVADASLIVGVLATGLATWGYLTRPTVTVAPLAHGAAAVFSGSF